MSRVIQLQDAPNGPIAVYQFPAEMSSSRKYCALRVLRPPGGNFICSRPGNWQHWRPAGVYQSLYLSFFDSFLECTNESITRNRKQQLTSVTDAITAKITQRSQTVESRRLNASYWLLSSPTRFLKKKQIFASWLVARLFELFGIDVSWGLYQVTWPANFHLSRNLKMRPVCTGHWISFIYRKARKEAVKRERLNVHKKPLHGRSVLETWKVKEQTTKMLFSQTKSFAVLPGMIAGTERE